MSLVENILFSLLVFFMSIIFHEFGHYVFADKFKHNPKVKHEGINYYIETDDNKPLKEMKVIAGMGVLFGLIPLLASILLIEWLLTPLIILYFAGSIDDIKIITRKK